MVVERAYSFSFSGITGVDSTAAVVIFFVSWSTAVSMSCSFLNGIFRLQLRLKRFLKRFQSVRLFVNWGIALVFKELVPIVIIIGE